jgi:hypothetical protein
MRKCVYVAGAISSDNLLKSFDNIRKGIKLSVEVLKAGFAPFSPFIDFQFSFVEPISLQEYYAYSMAWLCKADAVIVVPEWGSSKGTLAEIARAKELNIPIYYSLEELIKNENSTNRPLDTI